MFSYTAFWPTSHRLFSWTCFEPVQFHRARGVKGWRNLTSLIKLVLNWFKRWCARGISPKKYESLTTKYGVGTWGWIWSVTCQVARHTGLHCFTLTRPDGHQLQLDAAIGSAEQRLKVEPAYDVDSWGWRVGDRGLVERRSCAWACAGETSSGVCFRCIR